MLHSSLIKCYFLSFPRPPIKRAQNSLFKVKQRSGQHLYAPCTSVESLWSLVVPLDLGGGVLFHSYRFNRERQPPYSAGAPGSCSAGAPGSSLTVFLSHIAPALISSHQPGNNVFLSHHSSFSLQLQPAERSEHDRAALSTEMKPL